MPATFTLDHDNRLVLSRAWDVLTAQDLLDHVAAMRRHFDEGDVDGSWGQFADFSGVTATSDVTAEVVRELARSNPWPPGSRRVFLAPQTVIFGLGRMYQLLSGDPDEGLSIVRTREEALERLALTPPL